AAGLAACASGIAVGERSKTATCSATLAQASPSGAIAVQRSLGAPFTTEEATASRSTIVDTQRWTAVTSSLTPRQGSGLGQGATGLSVVAPSTRIREVVSIATAGDKG